MLILNRQDEREREREREREHVLRVLRVLHPRDTEKRSSFAPRTCVPLSFAEGAVCLFATELQQGPVSPSLNMSLNSYLDCTGGISISRLSVRLRSPSLLENLIHCSIITGNEYASLFVVFFFLYTVGTLG